MSIENTLLQKFNKNIHYHNVLRNLEVFVDKVSDSDKNFYKENDSNLSLIISGGFLRDLAFDKQFNDIDVFIPFDNKDEENFLCNLIEEFISENNNVEIDEMNMASNYVDLKFKVYKNIKINGYSFDFCLFNENKKNATNVLGELFDFNINKLFLVNNYEFESNQQQNNDNLFYKFVKSIFKNKNNDNYKYKKNKEHLDIHYSFSNFYHNGIIDSNTKSEKRFVKILKYYNEINHIQGVNHNEFKTLLNNYKENIILSSVLKNNISHSANTESNIIKNKKL